MYLKKWLETQKGKSNLQFSCILCKKLKAKSSWQLSNMGVGALDSHMKSNGHKKAEAISNIQTSVAETFQKSKSANNDKSKCAGSRRKWFFC